MSQTIESISLEFNKYQTDLQDLITSRQKLETQYQENQIVLNEFKNLESNAKIYKLTGPVLLPQDSNEANLNVEKRLEFIKSEIERVEKNVVDVQGKLEGSRNKLIEIRTAMAAQQQQQ
ncbi:Cortactin-binding protein [Wickerhamomyces ciferrii]|uniref:Cortactin-binding protein n=1 Tax=Wickerhamomyces ciferrii (strain ATCC 14091 / BCRC 22168 / CBS 111 / JCM 3599 / NBRC 0793 / NRRL Y-1031 F-60-10) TaxID=1206466 RepID=K0KIU3_WICCF|nr:Cortactin-binding protein [Wickerhamomyces ciferrii]CCH41334.1 Cortactin-binding protein [Wickerhamomyces ciferrii]